MRTSHFLLGLSLSCMLVATTGAQTVVWSDDFDSYETGSALHGQGGWSGWAGNPGAGEAIIVTTVARSAPLRPPASIAPSPSCRQSRRETPSQFFHRAISFAQPKTVVEFWYFACFAYFAVSL